MAYGELDDVMHPWRQPVAGPIDWLVAGAGALGALIVGWPLGGIAGLVVVGALAAGLALRWRGIAVVLRIVLLARYALRRQRSIELGSPAAQSTPIMIYSPEGEQVIYTGEY